MSSWRNDPRVIELLRELVAWTKFLALHPPRSLAPPWAPPDRSGYTSPVKRARARPKRPT